MRIRVWKRSV